MVGKSRNKLAMQILTEFNICEDGRSGMRRKLVRKFGSKVLKVWANQKTYSLLMKLDFLNKKTSQSVYRFRITAQQGTSENCQVGVFLADVSGKGHSLIDHRLYLPKSWADSPEKRSQVGVPETIKFATIAQLAQQMLQSASDAGIRSAWVVADEVYANDAGFWCWLEKTRQQPYVLTVNKKQSVVIGWQSTLAEALCQSLLPELSIGCTNIFDGVTCSSRTNDRRF